MRQKNFYASKRGKVWYFRFRDPETREVLPAVSSGLKNKTLADAWAQAEYAKREGVAGSCRTPYRDWILRFYTKDCPHCSTLYDKGKSVGETAMKQNRTYIETVILADPLCDMALGDIRRRDILEVKERIIAAKGRTRTAQMIFQIVCTSFHEATGRDIIPLDPAAGVPKISYERQVRGALPFRDVERIVDMAHWDSLDAWRMAYTAAYTGLRAGEVLGLMWQGVDNPRGRITVYNNRPARLHADKKPKWGKVRLTLYPARVREVLEPMRQDGGYVFAADGVPFGYDFLSNALDRACKRAGVRATMHQFRHSLQTHLRGAGVPDDMIRGAFGWSGGAVQDGYTHRELYDLAPIEKALG